MKKLQFLILSLALNLMLNAGIVEKTYYFNNPTVTHSGEFQMIYFENTLITGKTGEPALPYHAVQLLLPPGEKAISVEFIGEEEVQLSGVFKIYPQQASRPLSVAGDGSFALNELIYLNNTFYPVCPTGELITSYMNGYAFGLSSFTPVRYNPVTGIVSVYNKVKIKITTAPDVQSTKALENLKQGENIQNRLKSFAQNPEMMVQYPSSKSENDYQLLIITPNQFVSNFQDMIEIYLERGIKTQVVTREDINTSVAGQDLADKVRNYIIQEYQEHSVEYILLGGDVEHIPYRGFYCYAVSGSGYEDDNIPADLYYAALDGNWNTDSDNRWGEPGEDDLLPEVAIGRFSFSNVTELSNMLNKTISYQNSPVLGEFNNTLFAGEWLYGDPETWGSDYLELLIGHSTENGYETWGVPETYNFQKLYEENQSWGANDLITAINTGKQYVHHVGHANSNYVAYMENSDITNGNFFGANGTDHNYTIFHSHGCICGAFDDSDCIMEKMASIENFAVAVIGNSRYGWFNEGQTEGPAAHLHREMVDALYHEKINHIGKAFTEAKIQTAPWVTAPGQWEEGALRWNFYDINILGDPTLSVWTAEPISIQTIYENEILSDATSTSVTVTSDGNPMENLTCSILMDGILHGTGTTDASGVAQINFETAFAIIGEAQLIVTGYNCLPASYAISIVLSTGNNEINEYDLSVYPNPSAGNFTVQYQLKEETPLSVVLLNFIGQEIEVLSSVEYQVPGNYKFNFSLPELHSGIYFIRIETIHSIVTKKVVFSK
jgi:hypothetical protein